MQRTLAWSAPKSTAGPSAQPARALPKAAGGGGGSKKKALPLGVSSYLRDSNDPRLVGTQPDCFLPPLALAHEDDEESKWMAAWLKKINKGKAAAKAPAAAATDTTEEDEERGHEDAATTDEDEGGAPAPRGWDKGKAPADRG